jgi:DNA-binding transcriptional LysR family regulator
MELKSLYTVKKILETGSYQKAALALNYAQSTITFQMKKLEGELGIKLFEKRGNKIRLTEAAAEILPLIDKVVLATDELLNSKNSHGELRGALKVAMPESLITYKLQGVLQKFKARAPQVRLSLQVRNCFDIYEQLLSGKVDLAIHYDVGAYPKHITTRILAQYPLVLVGSKRLPEEEKDFVSPHQKKSVGHIINDPNGLNLKIFNKYLQRKKISLATELEVWSIEAVKRCVESNLGVAYLQRFTVASEIEQGRLLELPTGIKENTLTAVYAFNQNQWRSPALKLFLEILDAERTSGRDSATSALQPPAESNRYTKG